LTGKQEAAIAPAAIGYLRCDTLTQKERITRTVPYGTLRVIYLANVRQTKYDPLLRAQRSFVGQWTVDQWAPLDGRVINGGLRLNF